MSSTIRLCRGFSLLELLIVVCLVGIITSIAVPSLRNHVRKTNRVAAQSYMLDTIARQEQSLLDVRQYFTGTTQVPPPTDVRAHFAITVDADNAATPPTCLVTAAPVRDQAVDGGTMTLDCVGNKTPISMWQ